MQLKGVMSTKEENIRQKYMYLDNMFISEYYNLWLSIVLHLYIFYVKIVYLKKKNIAKKY
jgi:hypothetical protein